MQGTYRMKKQATFTGGDSDCRRGGASVAGIFGNLMRRIDSEQCLPDRLHSIKTSAVRGSQTARAGYVVFESSRSVAIFIDATYRINGTENTVLEPATPNFSGWHGGLAAIYE